MQVILQEKTIIERFFIISFKTITLFSVLSEFRTSSNLFISAISSSIFNKYTIQINYVQQQFDILRKVFLNKLPNQFGQHKKSVNYATL